MENRECNFELELRRTESQRKRLRTSNNILLTLKSEQRVRRLCGGPGISLSGEHGPLAVGMKSLEAAPDFGAPLPLRPCAGSGSAAGQCRPVATAGTADPRHHLGAPKHLLGPAHLRLIPAHLRLIPRAFQNQPCKSMEYSNVRNSIK